MGQGWRMARRASRCPGRHRYFDLTNPYDTLDKIDPVQMRQKVAAWTAVWR